MPDNPTDTDTNFSEASETAGQTAAADADTGAGAEGGPGELQRQRDEYKDLLLRKSAEFDNFRRRTERERHSRRGRDSGRARCHPGEQSAFGGRHAGATPG